jgi:hypothetical protein
MLASCAGGWNLHLALRFTRFFAQLLSAAFDVPAYARHRIAAPEEDAN